MSSSKLMWSSMSFCVPLCYRNHVSDFSEFLCKFQKLLHDRMILTCLCISVWISTMARRSKMSKKEFDDQFEAFLKDVYPVLSIYRFNKKITGLCIDLTLKNDILSWITSFIVQFISCSENLLLEFMQCEFHLLLKSRAKRFRAVCTYSLHW